MLELRHVTKRFPGDRAAVRDVSLTLPKGKLLVIVGSSGCGKTTLLKMINRLLEPTSGSIHLDRSDIGRQNPIELRRHIGYVFQGIGLFPHLSVGENVEMGLRLLEWPQARRRERADAMLTTVGLPPDHFRHRYPHEISGGQQQRVGVARALAPDPKYLLMDEPFGALDAITRSNLQNELRTWQHQMAKTVVFVTHDMMEAMILGDVIAVMDQGNLVQMGSPQDLWHAPKSPFVKELMSRPTDQWRRLQQVIERDA